MSLYNFRALKTKDVLSMNWDDIPAEPVFDPETYVPPKLDTRPITKEEYMRRLEDFRYDSNFSRIPLAGFVLEEYPEFAETRQQLALIQAQYAEKVDKARMIGDLKMEEDALKEKITGMKKLAKKNKALRKAKARLQELEKRRAELEEEMSDEEIDLSKDVATGVFSGLNIDNVVQHSDTIQPAGADGKSDGAGAGGEAEEKRWET